MQQQSERELVEDAKQGDKQAFGKLYQIYLKRIYRFLLFQLEDEHEAEDLTEQAFVKAWRKLNSFKITATGTFQAWLFQIARNLSLDYLRKKPTVKFDSLVETGKLDEIEEQIDLNSRQEKLKLAIKRLPPKLQQVVILKYFEELPYSQMAQVLGKRQGAIRVMVFRALKQLKNQLEDL